MSRILIARDPERAEALIARLRDDGLEAVAVPMTGTADLDAPPPLPLAEAGWIAVTSARAVRRLAAVAGAGAVPPETPIAALGSATAQTVLEVMAAPCLLAHGATGEDLARAILDDGRPGPVLWPCAETTAGGFAETLAGEGVDAFRWPLYRTLVRPAEAIRHDLEAAAPWDAAFFAAPSAVEAYAAAWPDPWRAPCVAIGPTTARALRTAGCPAVAEAEAPDTESAARAILAAVAPAN